MSLARPFRDKAFRDRLWLIGLAVVLPLAIMLLRGIDANWDLRNYHLYNPHALLTGRMLIDVAPAQLQSSHSPLLDVPFYLLVRSGLDLRWASAWLTLPFIAAFYCLLRLQKLLSVQPPSRLSQCVLLLLALGGAATWSTFANSMNDGFVAAAVLGGLVLVLGERRPDWRHWLVAGLLAGGVMGLKLTASTYCVALAFAALVPGNAREKAGQVLALAAGGLSGFVLGYGYWGWTLFKAYENPFFPYFNNVFQSPLLPAEAFADGRFREPTLVDALLSPLDLLRNAVDHSELYIRDPRLLIGLVTLIALGVLHWRRRPLQAEGNALGVRVATLLTFFFTSLLAWALQYGYYRYALTLELLGSLGLVLLLQWLPRGASVAMLAAALLVTAATTRPDWGHARSSAPMFGLSRPAIPADSMVLIATQQPMAYLVLGLPPDMPVVSVHNNVMTPADCSGMQERAKRRITGHAGPLWLLSPVGSSSGQKILSDYYGLEPAGACLEFPNTVAEARLCPQRRVARPRACAPPLEFQVQPVTMANCTPAQSQLRWSVADSAIGMLQVWSGNPGQPMELRLRGAASGEWTTAVSTVPGTRFELRDESTGEALATVTVAGPSCAASR